MHTSGVDVDRSQLAGWRNAIIVAFAIGGISLAGWGPRLPELRVELGVDIGTIGLMLGGVTIGSIEACSAPPRCSGAWAADVP